MGLGIFMLVLSGCAGTLVSYNNTSKTLSLKINDKENKEIKFVNPIYIPTSGTCIDNMYTIVEENTPAYGKIIVQHISISSNCGWNGLANGFFIQKIKKYYKTDNVKLITKEDVGEYAFSSYKLIDKYRTIYMIEIWGANQNTFIIDEDGKLYNELKRSFKNK
jgi:hypothetical protein